MEQEENEKKELYMPVGLRMNKEIFPGFTKKELKNSIVGAMILIITECIFYIMGIRDIGTLFITFMVLITPVVFMQIKGEMNLSPVDIIKLEIEFVKSQKYYPYIARNEWKDIE